ncbi:MAG TPA: alkaline phosphatase family protein [Candidatus Binatia bacterium]|nr:alkaline phosphatase family protein [Candidatus Binatia bacterium]
MERSRFTALAVAFVLASCGGGYAGGSGGATPAFVVDTHRQGSSGLIKHVVIMIQENRSFNNFFATFPGADGTTYGMMGKKRIHLTETNLVWPCDLGHSRNAYLEDDDNGKMDGFYLEGNGNKAPCIGQAGRRPYQYVKPAQIQPYWDMAGQYVLAEHMFQTQGSGSFTAHQDLIRGGTTFDAALDEALVDFPTVAPWGCNAPPKAKTSYLLWTGSYIHGEHNKGPFPCTNKFPGSGSYYHTLADELDAKKISWRYYTPKLSSTGRLWNAFNMIASVRYGPEWGTNVVWPETTIFTDITNGTLPAVSWLIPDGKNSDHPGSAATDTGPSWVASVVNAIGQSSLWDSTAIVVVWDDWGGFYDNMPPPPVGGSQFDHWGGLGFRVPCIIVSPYAREATKSKPGYISPTDYEFGSILKFVEDNWDLPRLGTTDGRANSIVDSFDFTQPPRTFTKIPSSYPLEYFEREAPSNIPLDSE